MYAASSQRRTELRDAVVQASCLGQRLAEQGSKVFLCALVERSPPTSTPTIHFLHSVRKPATFATRTSDFSLVLWRAGKCASLKI